MEGFAVWTYIENGGVVLASLFEIKLDVIFKT